MIKVDERKDIEADILEYGQSRKKLHKLIEEKIGKTWKKDLTAKKKPQW